MKPAREPASSQPSKALLCILEKAPRIWPIRPPCGPRRKNKTAVVRHQLSLRNLAVRAFDFRAQGFSPPLARRRSSCPPPSPNLVRTHPIEHYYQALRDSAPLLSRAARPPEGHQIGARKRRASGNTTLSQPYRRRVSTDRLNRKEGSQLASSLEGNPGPTPAGKTLPHSYPETRFRRERARAMILSSQLFWTSVLVLWTHQPGSHRRKVKQDFPTSLLRCLP